MSTEVDVVRIVESINVIYPRGNKRSRIVLTNTIDYIKNYRISQFIKEKEKVQDKMENVYALKIPLKVHLGWGINWGGSKVIVRK